MLLRFIFCFCYLQFDYPRNRLNENFFQEKPNLRKVFVFILQDINFHLPNLIMIRSSRSYVFRISHEKPVLESLFNKVAGREIYKFLRAPFSQSTCSSYFCMKCFHRLRNFKLSNVNDECYICLKFLR